MKPAGAALSAIVASFIPSVYTLHYLCYGAGRRDGSWIFCISGTISWLLPLRVGVLQTKNMSPAVIASRLPLLGSRGHGQWLEILISLLQFVILGGRDAGTAMDAADPTCQSK